MTFIPPMIHDAENNIHYTRALNLLTHAQMDFVSMAIKMAANFAETWQNCAFEDEEYAKGSAYTNVLSILTNTKE